MEQIFYTVISLFSGIFITRLWYNAVGLGYSTILMRRTINDCLLVMAKNIQSSVEISELKYYALDIAGRDDKYIEFQRKADEMQMGLLKKTIIRDFISSVPPRYEYMIGFHDWQSAMDHLTKELKRRSNDD